MEETWGRELVGQTVKIIGGNQAVGYTLQVKLLSGLVIQNVSRVDFDPILPNKEIWVTLTLDHIEHGKRIIQEQVHMQAHIDIPAIVREEKHIDG